MTTHVREIARLGSLLLALSAVAVAARPQDEGGGLPPELTGAESSPAERMTRLFLQVERTLERIDVGLLDAAAGDVPLAELGASGLDELLRRARADGDAVCAGIDEILELARKHGGGSCSQCMNPKPGGGGGQRPGESDAEFARREGPPRANEPAPSDPPKPLAPQDDQDCDDGELPRNGDRADGGDNVPGPRVRHDAGEPAPAPADEDAWGVLPPKVQEMFRNEGTEDVPVLYRDWIDAYYRRLASAQR